MTTSTALAALLLLLVGGVLGAVLATLAVRARQAEALATLRAELERERVLAGERLALARADETRERRVADLVGPVAASLASLHASVQAAEAARLSSAAALGEQLRASAAASEAVRSETGRLTAALRRSEVRGRWGEMQLRRVVEAAGLLAHVHFDEQVHTSTDDGVLRPDMVVHLAGGRHVVVDAKVALDAYLDAVATDDPEAQAAALARHAATVATHVDRLAAKDYPGAIEGAADFVVMFLPLEPLLSAALDADPSLLDRAFARQVVLATPTTLGALLRTVAMGWRQEEVAAHARELHDLGRDLHARLATLGGHLGRLGSSLDTAVHRYNEAMGSLESRVLVSARRFQTLGVPGDPVPAPPQLATAARVPAAPEFHDAPVAITEPASTEGAA